MVKLEISPLTSPCHCLNVEELAPGSSFDRQVTHVRTLRQLKIKWLVCCHGDMLHLWGMSRNQTELVGIQRRNIGVDRFRVETE